jgi:hypothetical protein
VVTIRCTQKLLRRVGGADSTQCSDTLLGDWYATLLFAKPSQLVLCVSERTLLPVVVTARDAGSLGFRLRAALQQVLLHLGVAHHDVEIEAAKMDHVVYGPTQNRRVLGTVNDFMYRLRVHLEEDPAASLLSISLSLADTPCGAIDYQFPGALSSQLFRHGGGS